MKRRVDRASLQCHAIVEKGDVEILASAMEVLKDYRAYEEDPVLNRMAERARKALGAIGLQQAEPPAAPEKPKT